MLKTQLKFLITIVLVLGMSISLQSLIAAWQAPSADPPSQPNIFKPINEGMEHQIKQGNLDISGNFGVGFGSILTARDIVGDSHTSLSGSLNLDAIGWGMNFTIDSDDDSTDSYVFNGNGNQIMELADTGDLDLLGSLTANSFIGDGSNLTNLPSPPLTEGHCNIDSDCDSSNWVSQEVIDNLSGACTSPDTITDSYSCLHGHCLLSHIWTNSGRCSCFIAGTQVLMANGKYRNIEDIQIGDKVIGQSGVNTVLAFDRPLLKKGRDQRLISINNDSYFMTDNHPVMTIDGWKSVYPESAETEAYDILHGNISKLEVGDLIIALNNNILVKKIDIQYEKSEKPVKLYNFVLNGDYTYYANNILVLSFVPDKAGRFLIVNEH